MSNLFDLSGKVAIVTGASTGLGQGMSLGLAEAGADLVLVDYVPSTETEEMIKKIGRKTLMLELNLMKMESIPTLVDKAIKTFGKIDILVNNAGIIRRTPALDFSESDWDDVLQINLKALFFLSQAAGKVMAAQGGGKIINTCSMLSFQGGLIVPAYTAAKSAVAGVTRALANEWAKYNINVNGIAPGYMATDNTAPLRADQSRADSILSRIPAARWGTPEDLQGVVVLLASRASDYMFGSIIPVDGGWLVH